MNYHPDDFLALVTQVEHEGGYVQPDPCNGQVLRYTKPEGGQIVETTTHCGLHARVAIPYDPTEPVDIRSETEITNVETGVKTIRRDWIKHDGETPAQQANFVAVCAVDDAVGLWPRYDGLMSDASYQPLA